MIDAAIDLIPLVYAAMATTTLATVHIKYRHALKGNTAHLLWGVATCYIAIILALITLSHGATAAIVMCMIIAGFTLFMALLPTLHKKTDC